MLIRRKTANLLGIIALIGGCSKVDHVGKNAIADAASEVSIMSDDVVADTDSGAKKEITQLKQKDTQLAEEIEKETKARQEADAQIKEDIATLEKKVEDYKKELDLKILGLDKELESVKIDILTNYATKSDLEAGLSALQVDLMNELSKTQEQLVQFQEYAAKTYATKKELAAVKSDLDKLGEILAALGDKVTTIDARENEHYDYLIIQVTEVRNEIKIEINNLKIALTEAIKEGDESLKAELDKKIKEQESRLGALDEKVTSEVRRLEKKLERLANKIKKVQKLARENKEAIERNLKTMEQEFKNLNAKDAETAKAIEQLKKDLKDTNLRIDDVTDLVNAFKQEFDNKLDGVRNEAMSAVSFLGEEVAKAFAQDNAQLTEKLQRAQAMREAFFHELSAQFPDSKKFVSFRDRFEGKASEIVTRLKAINSTRANAEQDVVDVIARNILTGNAARQFQEIARNTITCDTNAAPVDAAILEILGRPYFFDVAIAFINQIIFGSDFPLPPVNDLGLLNGASITENVDANGLFLYILLTTNTSATISTSASCSLSIEAFVSAVISSTAFLEEFNLYASQTNFYHDIIQLYTQVKELGSITAELAKMCHDDLGSRCSEYEPRIAQYIGELTANDISVMQLSGAIEDVYVVAKDVLARNEDNKNRIIALEQKQDNLNETIINISNTVVLNTTNINNAFYLIQILAQRLGYEDIANEAIDHMTDVPEDIQLSSGASCLFTQHRYIHHTDAALATAECKTPPSPNTNANLISDCQIHALRGDGENPNTLIPKDNLVGYTWGNKYDLDHGIGGCYGANGWQCYGNLGLRARNLSNASQSGQHLVTNGLKILALDPTDPKAMGLAALQPDQNVSVQNGESTFVLDIFGNATRFQIDVESTANTNWKKYSVNVDVAALNSSLVNTVAPGIKRYSIPLPKAIQKMGNCHWSRKITVQAFNGPTTPGETNDNKICYHTFNTFSPIVLKLKGHEMIQTVSPLRSLARFDIDANGIKDSTGWINTDSGFLAIDLNQNGIIDDGRELFGEASKLPSGDRAANGYLALQAYDSANKGYLDASDPVFAKLMVWVDINKNGVSEKGELFTAKGIGITRIDTGYEEVAKNLQTQTEGLEEGNLVKYQSKYYGPAHCGSKGCMSYDIFFGKTENYVLSSQEK